MTIQARCPECNRSYSLADHLLGKSVRCKECDHAFTVQPLPAAGKSADRPKAGTPGMRAGKAPDEDEAPRRRRDDEDAPRRRPRKRPKRGLSLTAWLLIGGGSLLAVAGVVVAVALLSQGTSSPSGGARGGIPDVDLSGEWPQPRVTLIVPPELRVTFHVAGVSDRYTRAAVLQGIDGLTDEIKQGARGSNGLIQKGRGTFVAGPIADPEACVKKIAFGEVRGASGRVITVVASKVEGPPPGSDELATALFDLKTPYKNLRFEALQKLPQLPPDERRRAEVAGALREFFEKEADEGRRVDVVKALGKWGTKDSAALLVRALDDEKNVFLVMEAMNALGALRAPEGIEPLVQRLEKHGPSATNALRAYGAAAEPALLKSLASPTQRVRELTCQVLKDIATKAAVPALTKALEEQQTRTNALLALGRLKAVEAVDAIARCLSTSDRGTASNILKGFGPAAERAVAAQLQSREEPARWEACVILKEIGSRESIPAIQAAMQNNLGLQNLANDTIKAILARR
jgi:predicted Zn finger-like uncharacterized protein